MTPLRLTVLVAFLRCGAPAFVVAQVYTGPAWVPFGLGCAAVAALLVGAVAGAARRGWVARVALGLAACGVAPFVAGATTGLGFGLLKPRADGILDVALFGVSGALFLYPHLFGAAVLVWGASWGVHHLAGRRPEPRRMRPGATLPR